MKCDKKQKPNIIEEINNIEGLDKEETGVKKIEYIYEEKEDIQYVRGKAKYVILIGIIFLQIITCSYILFLSNQIPG